MDEPNDNDTEELPAPEYWVELQPLDGPTVTPCDDGENPRDPLLVFDYPECGLCSGIWRGPDRGERLARAVKEPGTRYALFDLLDEPQAAAKIQHILAHPAGRYDRLRRFIDELPPERRARIVKAIDRHIEPNGLDCVRWHIDPDELAAALLDEANRQAGENPAPATPAPVAEPEAQPTEAGAAGASAKGCNRPPAPDMEVTQAEAAQIIGVDERTIRNWENGARRPPPNYPGRYSRAKLAIWANDYNMGKAGKQAANRELVKQRKEIQNGGGR